MVARCPFDCGSGGREARGRRAGWGTRQILGMAVHVAFAVTARGRST